MNLKLEKDLKSKRILLSVKPKTGAYSRDLGIAFLIAAGFHLMAFTLFRINLGDFFSTDTVPSVSFVSTETRALATGLPGDEKQDDDLPSYLQIDRTLVPPLPFFHTSSFNEENPYPPFKPDLRTIFLEDKTALCKSKWHFSKGIFLAKNLPELTCKGERKASFAFLLHDASIFWLEMIQSTGDSKLDRELEESLKGLQIASLSREGVVEVEFLP